MEKKRYFRSLKNPNSKDAMKRFGLIGHPLKHSLSKERFNEKFKYEQLDCLYQNFDLKDITELKELLEKYPDLCGLNVTHPYKEAILPYLDDMDETAKAIGAVNTVSIREGLLKGYNTDAYGFEILLEKVTNGKDIAHALVLGTGGASKAVQFVLQRKGIPFSTVSRSAERGDFTYETLTDEILRRNTLIINATPLGMMPHIDDFPEIQYNVLSKNHILIDLIYNPKQTAFMELGKTWGAKTYNGMQMLEEQAKRSWEIWQQER